MGAPKRRKLRTKTKPFAEPCGPFEFAFAEMRKKGLPVPSRVPWSNSAYCYMRMIPENSWQHRIRNKISRTRENRFPNMLVDNLVVQAIIMDNLFLLTPAHMIGNVLKQIERQRLDRTLASINAKEERGRGMIAIDDPILDDKGDLVALRENDVQLAMPSLYLDTIKRAMIMAAEICALDIDPKDYSDSIFENDLCHNCQERLRRKYPGRRIVIPKKMQEAKEELLWLAFLLFKWYGLGRTLESFCNYAEQIEGELLIQLRKNNPKIIWPGQSAIRKYLERKLEKHGIKVSDICPK